MVGDGDVLVADLDAGGDHCIECVLSVAISAVHVEIAADVRALHQDRQQPLSRPFNFAGSVAQLSDDEGESGFAVDILFPGRTNGPSDPRLDGLDVSRFASCVEEYGAEFVRGSDANVDFCLLPDEQGIRGRANTNVLYAFERAELVECRGPVGCTGDDHWFEDERLEPAHTAGDGGAGQKGTTFVDQGLERFEQVGGTTERQRAHTGILLTALRQCQSRSGARFVRVGLVSDDPSVRPSAAGDTSQEHRALVARYAVVMTGHVTYNPAPHRRTFN